MEFLNIGFMYNQVLLFQQSPNPILFISCNVRTHGFVKNVYIGYL